MASDDQKRQDYVEDVLRNLISNLPTAYNKEITDTNFYKLLRALTYEIADAKISIDKVQDNAYIDTATGDSIYNNFGVFVKLQKRDTWTEDKYKSLIKGVTQALLKGPNKQNLLEAFKLFTQFDVSVFELYKDKDLVDPSIYQGYNPKYTFLLQIEKPLDADVDASTLIDDANYIVNIIKPAHTIGIHIINLRGDENFRQYYGVEKKIADLAEKIQDKKIEERIDDWIAQYINPIITNYAIINNVSIDEATDAIYEQNYGMTKDEYNTAINSKANDLYEAYRKSFNLDLTPEEEALLPYNLNDNDGLIPVLDIDYFKSIAISEMRGVLDTQYINSLRDQYYEELKAERQYTITQLNKVINDRKNQLIASYIANGNNPDDYTDDEWRQKAIDSIKDEALTNKVIDDLGGDVQLFNDCLTEASKYRDQYESSYTNHSQYFGMDKIYVETNNISKENIYGWKSLTYPGQLYTSISFNGSKIGGASLIGPRFVLYDTEQSTLSITNEEQIRKNKTTFVLNQTRTLQGALVLPEEDKVDLLRMDLTEESIDTNSLFDVRIYDANLELAEVSFRDRGFKNLQVNNPSSNLNDPIDILMATDVTMEEQVTEMGIDVQETYDVKTKVIDYLDQSLDYNEVYDTTSIGENDSVTIYKDLSENFISPIESEQNPVLSLEENYDYAENYINFQLNGTFKINEKVGVLGDIKKDIYVVDLENSEAYDTKLVNENSLMDAAFEEIIISYKNQIDVFVINDQDSTLSGIRHTLSIAPVDLTSKIDAELEYRDVFALSANADSASGRLFRVDGNGVETDVEVRAAI